MFVEVKDFFKNNPHFMQNSVLIINDSNVNKIKIFGAEWLSPLDSGITYCGDNLNKIELVKKGLTDYYHNNPKLHYYIVYYNDSTIEEQGLIDETYNFLVNIGADVILLEEIEWTWEPPDWQEIVK